MTVDVTILAEDTIQTLKNWTARLDGIRMAAFLGAEVGPYLQRRAAARFKTEGDSASGKWAPLLPATQNIRATSPGWQVGPAHPINKRTGELEAWVTQGQWAAMSHPEGASLRYPSNAPNGELAEKVQTAQKGKSKPRTVARPVLAVDETDVMFITTRLLFMFQGDIV